MKNSGVIFANDVNMNRLQAVVGNCHRLGMQNVIVTNIDGTKYRESLDISTRHLAVPSNITVLGLVRTTQVH